MVTIGPKRQLKRVLSLHGRYQLTDVEATKFGLKAKIKIKCYKLNQNIWLQRYCSRYSSQILA